MTHSIGVVGEHGIPALDVLEVANDRLGGTNVPPSAEVPLQVADPQDHLGDGGGPGVELQAEQLVGIDADPGQVHEHLALAQALQGVEDLALQALEVFEGHVEEVAGAAGGVEHPHPGQADLEGGDQLDGLGVFALFVQGEGGAVDRGPFLAQGLDDGGQDQALDVGPRGVVGAEAVALQGVQGAFEQGAEDGGLHMAPVGAAGVDQQVDLRLVERQGLGLVRRGRR